MLKRKLMVLFAAFIMLMVNVVDGVFYYVNTYSLNVRGDGLWNSSIISVIHNGDKVVLLEDAKYGWKKIQLSDGTIGYVNGKFLSTKPQEMIYGTKEDNWKTVKVNVFRAFIRDNYYKNPIAIGSLGENLEVIGELYPKKGWIKVRVIDKLSKYYGREGYIGKKLVDPVTFQDGNYTYEYSNSGTDGLYSNYAGKKQSNEILLEANTNNNIENKNEDTDVEMDKLLSELFDGVSEIESEPKNENENNEEEIVLDEEDDLDFDLESLFEGL